MRVAFIHSGYSRRLVSGIIRVENELIKALRAAGHHAEIMSWDENLQGPLVAQRYMRIVRPMVLIYDQIKEYIIRGRFDVVVFPGVGYPETRALPSLKKETNARFVIIQHGWPLHHSAVRLLINSYMQTVGQSLLDQADAVVAVSNYIRTHLAEYREPEKIQLVPPGVDVNLFKPASDVGKLRKKWDIKQKYVLLGNGKLSALKNYPTALRALSLLPKTELLLVGSGSETKQHAYQQLARDWGVASRVRFLGTLPNEQLPELYALADLLVHPSKSEALGIVLLEALACATPVVVADVGGVRDVVINDFNGLLYQDPKDYRALAARVRELLANPQKHHNFGQRGRALVKAQFNWATILPQYINILEQTYAQAANKKARQKNGVFGAFA